MGPGFKLPFLLEADFSLFRQRVGAAPVGLKVAVRGDRDCCADGISNSFERGLPAVGFRGSQVIYIGCCYY